jgi:hypothetical protein
MSFENPNEEEDISYTKMHQALSYLLGPLIGGTLLYLLGEAALATLRH